MDVKGVSSVYTGYPTSYTKGTQEKKEETSTSKTAGADATDKAGGSSQIKNVDDYKAYLQNNYSYFNKSTMLEGVSVSYTVSDAFLSKCLRDPKQAKLLEDDLKAIPESIKFAQSLRRKDGRVLISSSYHMNENGEVSLMTTTETAHSGNVGKTDSDKAREKKAKEKKTQEEAREKKTQEEAREKKAQEEAREKKAQEKKARENKTQENKTQEKIVQEQIEEERIRAAVEEHIEKYKEIQPDFPDAEAEKMLGSIINVYK